jgi:type I restriction enzyme S subunit
MSFLRYPRYKPSGVEWLGDVPEHWEVKRVKFAARLVTERAGARKNPVALENIEGWTGRLLPTDSEFEGDGTQFRAGDILFGKLRPYLAKIHLAETDGEAVGDFHVMRPAGNEFGRFLQYSMLRQEFIHIVDGTTFGSKMPRASWEALGGMPAVLPPLPEQRAIAAFLDRETAKIDELIAEQQRLIELLQEKRQAVISHAVTKGLDPNVPMKPSGVEWLGDVPEHWEIRRVASLFRSVSEPGEDGLPILSVSIHDGVSDKEMSDEELDRKVTRSDDRSKYIRVLVGDLVYNMMRAWQGAFGTVTTAGLVSPAYIVARPTTDVRTDYLERLLRTPQAIEQMRRLSRGITDFRLRLYWDEFKNIRVPKPPSTELCRIVNAIIEMEDGVERLMVATRDSIALLSERRSALISAAVTGQIDVRNAVFQEAA